MGGLEGSLIHTVLVRRGLTRNAVLPVSPVLLMRSREYVDGLTAYRYNGPSVGHESERAVSDWLRVFLKAVDIAVTQAEAFATSLHDLRTRWEHDVAVRRREQNLRATPRSDSAVSRILETLQNIPYLPPPTL